MTRHDHLIERDKTSLVIAISITTIIFIAEIVGGILSNSLALMADAIHMFTDIAALGLGLFALWLTTRPAPPQKTYGYYRTEILAALANGVFLVFVALAILYEAYTRLLSPERVEGGLMLGVALVGLIANVVSASVLSGHIDESLNIRAAFAHVISDVAASLGAVAAGAIILLTGFLIADPAVSIIIGILVIYSAWKIVLESIDVLMEAAPAHINLKELEQTIMEAAGVKSVHDLHVWTVTSGLISMSGHVVVDETANRQEILEQVCSALERRFGLTHCTIQLELESVGAHEKHFW